jgi:predicted N-acetyltransferase YhbS
MVVASAQKILAMQARKRRASRRLVKIRRARAADAAPIAALCHQLGYPSSRQDVARRLTRLARDQENTVLVAENGEGMVVGWVHAGIVKWIENDPWVEVGGLVVDKSQRGAGIGERLLRQAERWARSKRVKLVRLRSNIIRKHAHGFYQKRGYEISKTQFAFQKTL